MNHINQIRKHISDLYGYLDGINPNQEKTVGILF